MFRPVCWTQTREKLFPTHFPKGLPGLTSLTDCTQAHPAFPTIPTWQKSALCEARNAKRPKTVRGKAPRASEPSEPAQKNPKKWLLRRPARGQGFFCLDFCGLGLLARRFDHFFWGDSPMLSVLYRLVNSLTLDFSFLFVTSQHPPPLLMYFSTVSRLNPR